MKFTYETQGAITYLVCELEATEQLDGLTLGMLTNNHIAGFAPVLYTEMNGQRYLKYNISAKVSVDQFFSGTMNKQRALTTFRHILDAICSADEYMIDINCFSMQPEHIFLNVSSCETALICIPIINNQDVNPALATLFKKIMFSTQFDSSEDASYITHMIAYVNSPDFTVYGMKDLVEDLLAGKAPQVDAPAQPSVSDTLSPFDSTISIDEMPAMLAMKEAEQTEKVPVQPPAPPVQPSVPPVQPPVPPVQSPVKPPVVPVQPPVSPAKPPVVPVQPPVSPVKPPVVPLQPPVPPVTPPAPPVQPPVPVPPAPPVQPPVPPVIKPAVSPVKPVVPVQPPVKSVAPTPDPGFAIPGQAPASGGAGFAVPGQQTSAPAAPAKKKEKAAPAGEKKSFFSGLLSKKSKSDDKNKKATVQPPVIAPGVPPVAGAAPAGNPQGGFVPAAPPVPAPVPVPVQNSFNETTVLSPAMLGGETTVLSANPAVADPCLIRNKTGERISINKPVFRIGKEKSYVDYFIGDNTAISRSHANIHTEGGEYFVEDTNSTNHTYVNGRLLTGNEKCKLTSGDKVRLANEDFTFTV